MFYNVTHVMLGFAVKLVTALNRQENMETFIPKKEGRFSKGRNEIHSSDVIQHAIDNVGIRRFVQSDNLLVGLEDKNIVVDKFKWLVTLLSSIHTNKLMVTMNKLYL